MQYLRTYRKAAALGLVLLAGCYSEVPRGPKPNEAPQSQAEHHAHAPGAHGGVIIEIGRESYHAEAVLEKGGVLRLFTLGKDETKLQEVAAEPVAAFVKPVGGSEAYPIIFRPEPQKGDAPGMTSQFSAHLPREVLGQGLDITIPNLRFGSDRFRVAFPLAGQPHAATATPGQMEDERKLYLTPGGKYTREDIRANGNTTPSEKFKGLRPNHDLKPKSGDKICPITLTKANPQFTWVVDGKTYEFCCPPCIDEFVALAKEMPESIKEPEFYRKK